MINRIRILEEVLTNVQCFESKEMIIHEIKVMIREAEEQLEKDEIENLKDSIEFCRENGMIEEMKEYQEILDDMIK